MGDNSQSYIETPRSKSRPVRIDEVLANRMREFMLARHQRLWCTEGR